MDIPEQPLNDSTGEDRKRAEALQQSFDIHSSEQPDNNRSEEDRKRAATLKQTKDALDSLFNQGLEEYNTVSILQLKYW
jgi:hypothetical protein